uniref:DsbA family protein n=1 Tax=Xanthobacter autotrophicus TaxID=280 RepID=UPI00372D5A41
MLSLPPRTRYRSALLMVVVLIALGTLVWRSGQPPASPVSVRTTGSASRTPPAGPTWLHGQADARFTITLYADLECLYCKAYYPVLKAWIDRHPHTALGWHHLPLPLHEPAATRLAVLAECAGEIGGQAAFWDTVTWIYQHTLGDGRGLSDKMQVPGMTPAVQACLDSDQPKEAVQAQVQDAEHDGIDATPTLKLTDRSSGRTLVLAGPIEGDTLLSALDLLSTRDPEASLVGTTMPDDAVGELR